MSDLRELAAKAIHGENDSCHNDDSWADMRKAGYECGCFGLADAALAALASQPSGPKCPKCGLLMSDGNGCHMSIAPSGPKETSVGHRYTWQGGDSRRVTEGLDDGEMRWQAETLHEMLDRLKIPRGDGEENFSLWGRVDAALKSSYLKAKLESLRDELDSIARRHHASVKALAKQTSAKLTAIIDGKD